MPKIQYIAKEKGFKKKSLKMIEQAAEIIAKFDALGYDLTLRQLYYQFVKNDWLPNTLKSYKALGQCINDARLEGLIDWDSISDRTRQSRSRNHWDHPKGIIANAAEWYGEDLWADQPNHVEVWVEKDAMLAIVERACQPWDVTHLSCRGYTSQSEMWRCAMRLERMYRIKGKMPTIIHLGDHDPSGLDMTRDIADRLEMFITEEIDINRIALNMDQIRKHKPPPNPAKITDSRARGPNGYIAKHGPKSWELDALDPVLVHDLIVENIKEVCDIKKFHAAKERQEQHRKQLHMLNENYDLAIIAADVRSKPKKRKRRS